MASLGIWRWLGLFISIVIVLIPCWRIVAKAGFFRTVVALGDDSARERRRPLGVRIHSLAA